LYFSEPNNWQDNVLIKAVNEDGYVETALSRRRYPERIIKEPKVDNQIKNFPIQGTAADGFKTALCQLDRKFQKLGLAAHLVLTMYDEVVVEVKVETTEVVRVIVEDCMMEAFRELVPGIPFELDMRIADSWSN
jgi:DNA polymerase I